MIVMEGKKKEVATKRTQYININVHMQEKGSQPINIKMDSSWKISN